MGGGVTIPCLLDTGSMVTTIPERLFHQHFDTGVYSNVIGYSSGQQMD